MKKLTAMEAAFNAAGVRLTPGPAPLAPARPTQRQRQASAPAGRAVIGTDPAAWRSLQAIEHQADVMALVIAIGLGQIDRAAAIDALGGQEWKLRRAKRMAVRRARQLIGVSDA